MNQTRVTKPINFKKWIDENRHLLKPPVCNVQVWQDREFMVTVVGGPNARKDYHINEGEEFFYQLEGKISLKILEDGEARTVEIDEGEIFLLPPNIPHSPQRPAGTVGLVLERRRLPHELDSFLWLCDQCSHPLYKESVHLVNIVTQLPDIFKNFYGNASLTQCKNCGTQNVKKS
jgi:3-hydroxyanthranilate 3,4-dioxygenase